MPESEPAPGGVVAPGATPGTAALDPGCDEALMLRAAAGDRDAFGALYDRWSGPIHRYFFHLCHDRSTADDFLHETFLRIWRAAPRYEVRARFSTFLFHVAKNLWINDREKVRRRPGNVSLDAGFEDGEDPLGARTAGDSPDPAQEAARRETGRRIRAAMEHLSDKLRPVFILGAVEGLPYEEVSRILEIPVGTVKSRMWAAMRVLRTHLGDLQ